MGNLNATCTILTYEYWHRHVYPPAFLKADCEYSIDVFPCDPDVFLNEQVCLCTQTSLETLAQPHLQNWFQLCLLLQLSSRPWHLYCWEAAQKHVVPGDREDTHKNTMSAKKHQATRESIAQQNGDYWARLRSINFGMLGDCQVELHIAQSQVPVRLTTDWNCVMRSIVTLTDD